MEKLKDEFIFSYKQTEITARKLENGIYYARGKESKLLYIEIYEQPNKHKGRICIGALATTLDNKTQVIAQGFLSWLPSSAFEGGEIKRKTGAQLIAMHDLKKECEICKTTKRLEVHHVDEWAKSKNDDKSNLRVLCSSCHTIVHAIRAISKNHLTPTK